MAPRKRRSVGRVKGSIIPPPTSTHAVNTRGFAAQSDEIYLEIVSHIPSVPIPTLIYSKSYPEIRRSRHETFLYLSQTSRLLRRFFWRYLWQRIEVREGTKIGDKDGTLKNIRTRPSRDKYAIELVRQLEIVTIRNPLLAQYVNYLDIFIGENSAKAVLAELARCLSLFSNLHTVQIDVVRSYGRENQVSFEEIFEQTFKKYSYPQIRNVFVMFLSVSFVGSCPQARRVGFTRNNSMTKSCVETILGKCPHLEELEGLDYIFWLPDACNLIVNNLPNLRTIQFSTTYYAADGSPPSHINILKELKHLQTIILRTHLGNIAWLQHADRLKDEWIELAKRILIHIQLRDNLEKTVVLRDYDSGNERRISLKPKSLFEEEGRFA